MRVSSRCDLWVCNMVCVLAGGGQVIKGDAHFRNRWRCMLSVDELVGAVVEALTQLHAIDSTCPLTHPTSLYNPQTPTSSALELAGILWNDWNLSYILGKWILFLGACLRKRRYIFFSSDHGFHFHNLRLGVGKWSVYDHDIRVPMLISGPGIRPGSVFGIEFVGSHVDLAPTWLALAGVPPAPEMDGALCAISVVLNTRVPCCVVENHEPTGMCHTFWFEVCPIKAVLRLR